MSTGTILRQFSSAIAERLRLGRLLGNSYGGKRNVDDALGYLETIAPQQYRERWERNEVAAAALERVPRAAWTGDIQVLESDKPKSTAFEKACADLATKLKLWPELQRADILSTVGRYAVILIGAEGDLRQPLERATEINYLALYGDGDATIQRWEENTNDPRFGQALEYSLKRLDANRNSTKTLNVHWTRIIHIPSEIVDDKVFGRPGLKRIWNRLDDLDKVVGGGSEAFWQRVQPGHHFKLDPLPDGEEAEINPADQKAFEEHIDEFMHSMRRYTLLRGVSVETPQSMVANFNEPADVLLGLISLGTGIPKRILTGSERGELASTQDRENFNDVVKTWRTQRAEVLVVRQFFDRMIDLGILPEPPGKIYFVRWPKADALTFTEKAEVADKLSSANSRRRMIITENEIRDQVFGLDPLDDEELGADATEARTNQPGFQDPNAEPAISATAASYQSTVTRIVDEAFRKSRSSVDIDILERALRSGDVAEVENILITAVSKTSEHFEAKLATELHRTLIAGGLTAENAQ